MIKIDDYLYQNLIGKKFHFKCDCTFPLDFVGIVKSYKLYGNTDVILFVERDDKKLVKITAKHPGLMLEEIK